MPDYTLDWGSGVPVNGTTTLTGATGPVNVTLATSTNSASQTATVGTIGTPAATALSVSGLTDAVTTTMTFDQPVQNINFEIYDIDFLANSWDDSLQIIALDANGNQVPISYSDLDGLHSISGDTVNADGSFNTGVETTGAEDSVSVSIAGPISSLTFVFDHGESFTSSGTFGIGNMSIDAAAPDYAVEGGNGDDLIDGAFTGDPENDAIDSNDALDGSNDDLVYGGSGNDTVLAGAGNDTIYGDAIFIDPADYPSGTEGTASSFTFVNNSPVPVQLYWIDTAGVPQPYNVVPAGGSVARPTFSDHIWLVQDPETGEFVELIGNPADGSTYTYDSQGADDLSGGSGDDTLFGEMGNDVLSGDSGNDTLYGGAGSDTFNIDDADDGDIIFGGEDTDGSDVDTLNLDHDTILSGVTVTATGAEAGTYDFDTTAATGTFAGIEAVTGTFYDDTFDMSADGSGVSIDANEGADSIIGGSGEDLIEAGAGADTINAGAGNDTITLGNGVLGPDGDADVIILQDGFGNDTILEFDAPTPVGDGSYTGIDLFDVTALSDGTEPVNVLDVTVTDDGSGNAVLTFPNGESVTLIGVDPLVADDPQWLMAVGIPGTDGTVEGTSGADVIDGAYVGDPDGDMVDAGDAILPGDTGDDDLIVGLGGDDTITAGAGNDEVFGGTGADNIYGGDGGDTLYGGDQGEVANLIVNGSFEDLTGTTNTAYGAVATGSITGWTDYNGGDLDLHDDGKGGTFATEGDYVLDMGGTPDNVHIYQDITGAVTGEVYNLTLDAGDVTGGGNSVEIYWGGELVATIDPVEGGMESYSFDLIGGSGDGANRLEFREIGPEDVDGVQLDNVQLIGVDGTAAIQDTSGDYIDGGAGSDTVYGLAGGDTVFADSGDDVVYGGAGSDNLSGESGNDTLFGGTGDDVLLANSGNDTVYGGDGNDTIATSIGSDEKYGGAGDDTISAGGFSGAGDTLSGGSGNDTLIGGLGDDSIFGGTGNDAITVASTGGTDFIHGDSDAGNTDVDTLTFADANGPDGVDIVMTTHESGTYEFAGETGNGSFSEIEEFNLTDLDDSFDGSADQGGAGVGDGASVSGGGGDDVLIGGAAGDSFDGGADNDTISGGAGTDTIEGGTGDDVISGDAAAPTGGLSQGDAGQLYLDVANVEPGSETGTPGDAQVGDSVLFNNAATLPDGTVVAVKVTVTEISDPDVTVDLTYTDAAGGDRPLLVNGNGDATNAGSSVSFKLEFFDAVTGDPITMSGDATVTDIDDNPNAGEEFVTFAATDVTSFTVSPTTSLTTSVADGVVSGTGTVGNGALDQTAWFGIGFENQSELSFSVGVVQDGAAYGFSGTDITNGVTTVVDGGAADSLSGGAGNDTIYGNGGDDIIDGGADDDVLFGGDGQDTLTGGDGIDTITGGADEDAIYGGPGDVIDGSEDGVDNDTLYVEGATNVFYDSGNPENGFITFATGPNLVFTNIENVVLLNDGTVSGTAGDDVIDATYTDPNDIDQVDNTDAIIAGHGSNDDLIEAGAGNDTVDSGLGADTVFGGTGDDLIYAGADSSNDTVFGEDGSDTMFGFDGDDEFYGGADNDTLDGDGGADSLYGGAGNDELIGDDGDDLMVGGDGADVFFGGTGADSMVGGGDGDVLYGGAGDIIDGSETGNDNDTLIVEDVDYIDYDTNPENGTVFFNGGGSLTFTNIENVVVTDRDGTVSGTAGNDIIDVTYLGDPDGDVVDGNDAILIGDTGNDDLIEAGAGDDTIDAGLGNDEIYGGSGADTVLASEGNDEIYGGTGDDSLRGGTGDDTVFGDDGADVINVGSGTDTAFGGAGNDSMYGSLGDSTLYGGTDNDLLDGQYDDSTIFGGIGDDTILVQSFGTSNLIEGGEDIGDGDTDIVEFWEDATLQGVTVTFTGDEAADFDFDDTPSTGSFSEIETVSGTRNDDTFDATLSNANQTLSGRDGDDTITGGSGADSITGGNDADVIYGGAGDTIDGSEGGIDNDTLIVEDVDYIDYDTNPENGIVYFNGGGTLTFFNIENVIVSDRDGTVSGTAGDDVIDAFYTGDPDGDMVDNNDAILVGDSGEDDLIEAGGGNDTVFSGAGNDEVYGGTGNDRIQDGIGDSTIFGEEDDDLIFGFQGTDTIFGGTGNDIINGGVDADSLYGGDDQDTFVLEADFGSDTIEGGEGGVDNDTIRASQDVDTTVLADGDEAGTITDGTSTAGFSQIETILTAGGNDTIDLGADGAGMTVNAGAGNDTITGGTGDDLLLGDDDRDTFVVEDNFGNDTILGGQGGDNYDIIDLTALSNPVSIAFTAPGAGTITDTVTGDVITFSEIEEILATEQDDIVDHTNNDNYTYIQTLGGNDSVVGSDGNDLLDDQAGFLDGAGNDTFFGGAGNDTVWAGNDDDTIFGGTGFDILNGQDGDDTITFAEGDIVDGGTGDDLFILEDLGETLSGTITVDGGSGGETPDPDGAGPLTGGDTLQLGSLGILTQDVKDTFVDDGTGSFSGSVTLDDGTILTFSEIENIICFTPKTRIATPRGLVNAEDLEVGDLVVTRDHGLQPIRWIEGRTVPAIDRFAPVRISKTVLSGQERDLIVSPQHRLLFQGYRAELLFGESEVLVAAKHLVDGIDVTQDDGEMVTYVHMLFDHHEIIFAEGAATESFHPGDIGFSAVGDEAREELFAIFPELRVDPRAYGNTARRCLKAHEAKLIRL